MSADPLVVDLTALQPAQQTHDVLVRFLDEAATTGSQSAHLERVEAVDRAHPDTILASQAIPDGAALNIVAGPGNDHITLDLSSFPPSASTPPITVLGGGHDTLSVISDPNQPLGWYLDGPGAGHLDGAAQVSFSGVDHLVGGGADTLHGSTLDTNWTVDGAGSGSVGATRFSGFANLVGPTGQNDVFNFTASGSLKGMIDGGGEGTLSFDTGAAGALVSTATGPHSGRFAYGDNVITYQGLAPTYTTNVVAEFDFILTSTSSTDHVQLSYDGTVGDANYGYMVLKSLDADFETQYFKSPTTTLKITGTSGHDDLNIMSLDPAFQAALTVNVLSSSYDPFNDGGVLPSNGPSHDSVIRVTGDLNLHGGTISLVADNTYVGTVAEQTGSTGTLTTSIGVLAASVGTSSWTPNQDYTHIATTGGSGSGATVSMSTDSKGYITAWLDHLGSGYAVGDVITASDPAGGGGTVSLTFRNIATSAKIITSKSGGNAGDINLGEQGTNPSDGTTLYSGGEDILLGSNASLIAEADPAVASTKFGKIAISTSDIAYRLVSWPADFTSKNSGVAIDGTTIRGGATKIYTTAEDLNLSTDVPAGFAGFVGSLATLLNNIPGDLISAFTGIDASVILRGANAKINIDDASITSAGTLDIKALTKVTTQVNAIANAIGSFGSGVSIAVGYGQANSDVEANIGGSSSLSATDSVTVSATGSVSSKTIARASSNLNSKVDPKSVSLALAFAYTDLTDVATVGRSASITSTSGNVNLLATGTTSTQPDSSTLSPIDGAAGDGAAVALEFANVQAHADGTIKAAGTFADPANTQIFSPTLGIDGVVPGVLATGNEIYLPGHGYKTGDLVTYTPYLVYTPPIPDVSSGVQDPAS